MASVGAKDFTNARTRTRANGFRTDASASERTGGTATGIEMNGDVDPDEERRRRGQGEDDGHDVLPPHPAEDCVFRVVEYRDRPDECTICPRSPSRDELITTWITASADASVDLGANR